MITRRPPRDLGRSVAASLTGQRMDENPYKSPGIQELARSEGVIAHNCNGESAVSTIRYAFECNGFVIDSNVDLGPAVADLLCVKRGFSFPLPHIDRYYVYQLPSATCASLSMVLGLHALSRSYTDRQHLIPRGFRLLLPLTVTVVLTTCPIAVDVADHIRMRKHRYQTDEPNTMFLVDLKCAEVYGLERRGRSVNLRRAHLMMKTLSDNLGLALH